MRNQKNTQLNNLKQYIQILQSKTKSGYYGLMTLGTSPMSKPFNWYSKNILSLRKYLKNYRECYLTQNPSFTYRRRDVDTSQLVQAFVDLDVEELAHIKTPYKAPTHNFKINQFIKDLNLDIPTAIMFSGHGFYLKWVFKQTVINHDVSHKLLYTYSHALQGLVEYINNKARKIYHKSKDWAIADIKATNPQRLLRMGNTWNHKGLQDHRPVVPTYYLQVNPHSFINYGEFITKFYGYYKYQRYQALRKQLNQYRHMNYRKIHGFNKRTVFNVLVNTNRMKLRKDKKWIENYRYSKMQKHSHSHQNTYNGKQGYFDYWALKDLTLLAKVRRGTGYRDLLLYDYASLLQKSNQNLSTSSFALALKVINSSFQHPCNQREIRHLVRQRKANTLRHHISRSILISKLHITPTEQRYMYTLRLTNVKRINIHSKHVKNKAKWHLKMKGFRHTIKAHRDSLILSLHAMHYTYRQITNLMRTSKTTISKVIKYYQSHRFCEQENKHFGEQLFYRAELKLNAKVNQNFYGLIKYENKRSGVVAQTLQKRHSNKKNMRKYMYRYGKNIKHKSKKNSKNTLKYIKRQARFHAKQNRQIQSMFTNSRVKARWLRIKQQLVARCKRSGTNYHQVLARFKDVLA